VVVAAATDAARDRALDLARSLREAMPVETDLSRRSLSAQLKWADRIGARFAVVLGEDEIAKATARVKEMATGTETEVALDGIVAWLGERG
jgi:histidyl-tRNA synthetase